MIKKFQRKVYARFKDNIWVTDVVEMGSLSPMKRGVKYLLCATDGFAKYFWVKTLKDKKIKRVLNSFIGIVTESKRKSNKLCIDQGKWLYKSLMWKYLDDNNILMHSTHNEDKSVVAEGTPINSRSSLGYFNKLVDEYNNIYHRSIGKKHIDTDYSASAGEIQSSQKAPKFKVGENYHENCHGKPGNVMGFCF